jgi:hypothetical protein
MGIHCRHRGCAFIGARIEANFPSLMPDPHMIETVAVMREGEAFVPGPTDRINAATTLYVVTRALATSPPSWRCFRPHEERWRAASSSSAAAMWASTCPACSR